MRRALFVSALLCSLLIYLGYRSTLDAYFVSDDFHNIRRNTSFDGVRSQLLGSSTGDSPNKSYRPLVGLTWLFDYLLWGADATAFRVHGLFWHLTTCLALAALVAFLAKRSTSGVLAAAVFAVHPLNSEAVDWISSRGDLIAATFSLTALLAFASWWARGRTPFLCVSVACFALALLAKESALAMPLLLATFLFTFAGFPRRRAAVRRTLVAALPFVVVLVSYGSVRALSLGSLLVSYPGWTPVYRLDWTIKAFSRLVVPLNTAVFGRAGLMAVGALCVLGFVLPAIAAGSRLRTIVIRERVVSFAVVGCLASLVPVIQFFQSMDNLQGTRMWYLPNAFFCAGVGHGFARLMSLGNGQRVVLSTLHATGLLALLLFVLTRNNASWIEAGRLSGELVSSVRDHQGDTMRLRLHRYLYDTVAGAYVLRNGLDVAFQPPFTDETHVVYGWKETMSTDEAPVPLHSLNEAKILWKRTRSSSELQPKVDLLFMRIRTSERQ